MLQCQPLAILSKTISCITKMHDKILPFYDEIHAIKQSKTITATYYRRQFCSRFSCRAFCTHNHVIKCRVYAVLTCQNSSLDQPLESSAC